MATKNSINNNSGDLTIDPGASGDSFIQFDINGTGEFRIGVDDTDDSFRVSQGSTLGATDAFIMTAAGERTMPLQSAFLAVPDEFNFNVTGDGTLYTMDWSLGAIFDQNSDFDGTSTFTSPRTGKFLFRTGFLVDIDSAKTSMYVQIVTSNRTFRFCIRNPWSLRQGSSDQYCFNDPVILCDMDSLDTAVVKIAISGGAKTDEVGWSSGGGAAQVRGKFCGQLAC